MKSQELNLTRPLLAWLRADSQWPALSWHTRAVLAWRATWGSLNLRQAKSLLSSRKDNVQPLLILGPWRSGTTAMHELLSQALGWPTPLTWQCMNACTFPLTQPPKAGRSLVRPMDGLVVSALTPQEDEFALLTLGAPSAYRAFWMPHRLLDVLPTLDQRFWLESNEWLESWQYFLDAVLARETTGRVLLKSPNHTFRVQALFRRYPRLKVVWMLRDPIEIYTSNKKMWRSMFEQHGLSEAREADLDRFLAKAIDASAEALQWAIEHLPPGQFVSCAQAELRRSPQACLQRVLDGLALAPQGDGATPVGPQRQLYDQPATHETPLQTAPPSDVRAALDALHQAQQAVLSRTR